MTAIGRATRSGFDRVGGTRLTALGTILLLAVVVGVANPPPASDRQILVLVWIGMVAVLVLGIVWPLVAVRRITVTARSPRDASVGDLVPIEVHLDGRAGACEIRALDPTGPWHRAAGTTVGTVPHLADRRGVFRMVRLEVRVTAPLGVLAAHRVFDATIGHPVEVAPKALAVDWVPAGVPLDGGVDTASLAVLGGDLVRSVRPYAPGDPAHLVHWPSTARTGTLVVRELEPPAPFGQVIVVDLRDLGPDKERAASYALGAARAVLAAGGELVLCTAEVSGPVTGRVRAPIEAGRRLARAVAAEPGVPPEGWPVVEIGR
ncbi:DUF58 domain-containing protein [Aquihabitans daechungensis]|uniref:DUF58 domain-containing protein n=1 Tax=Aquihabitans daechungensis TaxID=1052257 RepID=UPI003BA2FBED